MGTLSQLVSKSQFSNWYADRRWRAKREAQLQREPLCCFCWGRGRTTPATIADHIEPHRGDLGKFWYGALQSLCQACHSSTKQRMENGSAPIGVDEDGWPLSDRIAARGDPKSHWRR